MSEFQGKIIEIVPETTVTGKKDPSKTYYKGQFVVEGGPNPMYPETAVFEYFGTDKKNFLANFSIGSQIGVNYNIGGSKWEPKDGRPHKWFPKIIAWRVNMVQPESDPQPVAAGNAQEVVDDLSADDLDDLPF